MNKDTETEARAILADPDLLDKALSDRARIESLLPAIIEAGFAEFDEATWEAKWLTMWDILIKALRAGYEELAVAMAKPLARTKPPGMIPSVPLRVYHYFTPVLIRMGKLDPWPATESRLEECRQAIERYWLEEQKGQK